MTRPEFAESLPYHRTYIDHVEGDDLLITLPAQSAKTLTFWRGISEEESCLRPAAERWSFKQVLNHLNDTERVFTYRALRFARGDQKELPGFEQDDYARMAAADRLSWADLIKEYAALRQATLALFRSFRPEDWLRQGIASGHPLSVRAAGYIVAGHELHHLKIISRDYLK
ncbi:MAG: DinB family protein [Bryobacteraceae bacterium]|nr:DinB family protein [Bryobacteraceae bacterium]